MLAAAPLTAEPAANVSRPMSVSRPARTRDASRASTAATIVTTSAYTVITHEAWTTVVSSSR